MVEGIKPERVWRIGDKVFSTYEEARSYGVNNRRDIERLRFIECVREAIMLGAYGKADESDAERIADKILETFNMKRRNA